MTLSKKHISAFFSLAILVVLASVAFAEEAAHGGGHSTEITFWGDWFPRLVNFAIISIILVYFLRKPTRDFFKNRTLEIEQAMRESQAARERAVAALTEMERKVKDVEAETARMIAESRERGEKDKVALIEEGKKLVVEIQAQVKTGIEIELQKAKTELAVEASVLSVDLAEGKLKGAINKQDHERIVKEYIASVGGRG